MTDEEYEEFRKRKLAEAIEASPGVIGFGQWEKCGGPCCGGDVDYPGVARERTRQRPRRQRPS